MFSLTCVDEYLFNNNNNNNTQRRSCVNADVQGGKSTHGMESSE